jgi:hypothetical protein
MNRNANHLGNATVKDNYQSGQRPFASSWFCSIIGIEDPKNRLAGFMYKKKRKEKLAREDDRTGAY